MASWPDFKPTRLLSALVSGGVDFVVVGGVAVIALGYPRVTKDLDVCYAPSPENLEALGNVLVDLGARLRGVTDDVPFVADARTLRATQILTLDTKDGPLDVMLPPSGAPAYDAMRDRAEEATIDGVTVAIAALEDMIIMKRASGRPQDLADLEALEAIARLRRAEREG